MVCIPSTLIPTGAALRSDSLTASLTARPPRRTSCFGGDNTTLFPPQRRSVIARPDLVHSYTGGTLWGCEF